MRLSTWKVPLQRKITLAILATFIVTALLAGTVLALLQNNHMQHIMLKSKQYLQMLVAREADLLANDLFERRLRSIDLRNEEILISDDILSVTVYGADGGYLSHVDRSGSRIPEEERRVTDTAPVAKDAESVRDGVPVLIYQSPIFAMSKPIGFIRIEYSLAEMERERRVFILAIGIMIAITCFIMLVVLNLTLSATVCRPISYLKAAMNRIEEVGPGESILSASGDEIGDLISAFNRMSMQLRDMMTAIQAEISERRQAEDALRDSEAQFKAIFEMASIGIAQSEPNTRQWTLVNQKTCEITGYSSDEMLAMRIPEITHPEDLELDREAFQNVLSGTLKNYRIEMRYIRKDDTTIWVNVNTTVIRDSAGLPTRTVATIEDITERKRAEERLREYEKVVESLDEMIVVVNRDYRHLIANHSFLKHQGMDRRQVVGCSVAEVVGKDLFEEFFKKNLDECFKGNVIKFEMRYNYPELGDRDLLISYLPIEGPAGVDRIACVLQDITERKRMEEEQARVEAQFRQAQKMEALGTLAGGIAHDFNNILGVIFGYTELAQINALNPHRVKEILSEVIKAGSRAKDLVKQILAFSRQSKHEKRPVEFGLVVKEALKMLRASLPTTIEIKGNVDSIAVVSADPTQIHQILMNLCTNAAHAMRDGGGILEVNVANLHLQSESIIPHSGMKSGLHVKLTVKDTGHGIDPAIIERIFDPFFTTKEHGVGTGLGLAVVHGIVKSLEGFIDVESSFGKGTTFHVILPALETAAVESEEILTPLPGGQERVLVVDDEPILGGAMKQMLESLGYEVEYRSNAVEALEAFRCRVKPFDIVITDMTMPHMTGAELAAEILKLHPNLPILLCTGFSEKIDAEKAKNLGIKGLLMKPFVLRDLASLVRKAVGEEDSASLIQ